MVILALNVDFHKHKSHKEGQYMRRAHRARAGPDTTKNEHLRGTKSVVVFALKDLDFLYDNEKPAEFQGAPK